MMFNTLDVCSQLVEKFSDPEVVLPIIDETFNNDFSDSWTLFSLSSGLPSMIFYYSIMHLHERGEGYDKIAYGYFQKLESKLELLDQQNLSLYSGIAGLAYVTYISSDGLSRYQNLLDKLDSLLIEGVQKQYLSKINQYTEPYYVIPSEFYNLAEGLAGILIYLMQRQDHRQLCQLAIECIQKLIKLLATPKIVNGKDQYAWVNKNSEDHLYYRLDMPYGIPGVLGALNIAANNGLEVTGLKETISQLASWVSDQQIECNGDFEWPFSTHNVQTAKSIRQSHWFCGSLSLSRCLFVSGKILGDQTLLDLAQTKCYQKLLETDLKDDTLWYGKAGLLLIAYRMACDTEDPKFFQLVKFFEVELLKQYDPLSRLGFQTSHFADSQNSSRIDHPGLLTGSLGIALSLLEVQGRENTHLSNLMAI